MGILDNITSTVNRGTAAAGRSADKIKLNARISELNKQRQNLAAQLGASLYDATRDNAEFRSGREALYDGIAQVDAERDACKSQIAALEAQANAAATAATGFTCAVCGAHMSGADLFCAGCGTPAEKARPQAEIRPATSSGRTCISCGAPMTEGDVFCMSCGAKQDADAGIGDAEFIEVETNSVGESELVEVDESGNATITPGGER